MFYAQAIMIRLIFDDIKPIAKQNGYQLGYRWLNGQRKMTKYQTDDYKNFKYAIGLMAKSQCNKQRWRCTDKMVRVCAYLFWPRKERTPDIADNGFSGVYDALEGVVFDNDRRIKRVGAVEEIETDSLKRMELTIELWGFFQITRKPTRGKHEKNTNPLPG